MDSRIPGTGWVGESEQLVSEQLMGVRNWGLSVAEKVIREQGIGERVID